MRMAYNWRHGARVGKSCIGENTAKVQQNTKTVSTRVKPDLEKVALVRTQPRYN